MKIELYFDGVKAILDGWESAHVLSVAVLLLACAVLLLVWGGK